MAARSSEPSARQVTAAAKLASYKAEQVRLKEAAAERRAAAAARTQAGKPAVDLSRNVGTGGRRGQR
jgi:hypothetical protein